MWQRQLICTVFRPLQSALHSLAALQIFAVSMRQPSRYVFFRLQRRHKIRDPACITHHYSPLCWLKTSSRVLPIAARNLMLTGPWVLETNKSNLVNLERLQDTVRNPRGHALHDPGRWVFCTHYTFYLLGDGRTCCSRVRVLETCHAHWT